MKNPHLLLSAIAASLFGFAGCDRAASTEVDDAAARALVAQQEYNSRTDTVWESRETAFGYEAGSSTCFSEISGTPRWGWSIGPLSEGVDTFDIFAGAGRCDTAKGTKVGYGIVTYQGGVATVAFHAYPGQAFFEAHLYLGSDKLPRGAKGKYNVAPGQFPHQRALDNATSGSFTVTGLTGNPYLVLHLVSGPTQSGSSTGVDRDSTGTESGSGKDSTSTESGAPKDPFAGLH